MLFRDDCVKTLGAIAADCCADRLNSLLELTFPGDAESILYCFINSIKSKYNDTLGTINSSQLGSEFSTKNFELFYRLFPLTVN